MGEVMKGLHERHVFEDLIGAKAEFRIEQRQYVAMSEHPRVLASQNYTLQDIRDHDTRVQAWHRAWDDIKTRASTVDEHISDIVLKSYQPRSGSVEVDPDADARHAENLLIREAEMAAAERARQAMRERTGLMRAENLAKGESAAQRKAREMGSNLADGAINFAKDPAKVVGDAATSTAKCFAGNMASDAVGVAESVVGGATAIGDAVKAHTPMQKPRKRKRLPARRKEKLAQKVSSFPANPANPNPMAHPLAHHGF